MQTLKSYTEKDIFLHEKRALAWINRTLIHFDLDLTIRVDVFKSLIDHYHSFLH